MLNTYKVRAKRIFTPTKIPGAKYVVNQYVGCGHACLYCYAKFMCRWKNYGEWGSWVEIKENAPELARRFVEGKVVMSSVSDPYQPIEQELQLTRKILENMDKRTELSILTKSDLVTRDIDIFKEFKRIEVSLTLNGFEGETKNLFEPFSPGHKARLSALEALSSSGIKTYGFWGRMAIVDTKPFMLPPASRHSISVHTLQVIRIPV
jgi:DNA repair photolyase